MCACMCVLCVLCVRAQLLTCYIHVLSSHTVNLHHQWRDGSISHISNHCHHHLMLDQEIEIWQIQLARHMIKLILLLLLLI